MNEHFPAAQSLSITYTIPHQIFPDSKTLKKLKKYTASTQSVNNNPIKRSSSKTTVALATSSCDGIVSPGSKANDTYDASVGLVKKRRSLSNSGVQGEAEIAPPANLKPTRQTSRERESGSAVSRTLSQSQPSHQQTTRSPGSNRRFTTSSSFARAMMENQEVSGSPPTR